MCDAEWYEAIIQWEWLAPTRLFFLLILPEANGIKRVYVFLIKMVYPLWRLLDCEWLLQPIWLYYVFLFTFSGANVRKVLKILDVLDSHTFYSCRAHNPLTTLYCSLSVTQCSFEVPLTDEMLTMLLCQWAVTPYRSGEHRPLVVAMLLRQRQDDVMKVHGAVDKVPWILEKIFDLKKWCSFMLFHYVYYMYIIM